LEPAVGAKQDMGSFYFYCEVRVQMITASVLTFEFHGTRDVVGGDDVRVFGGDGRV